MDLASLPYINSRSITHSLNYALFYDEDIPTTPLPPSLQDEDDAAVKLKSNEVRIGPMTRARAKLLKQQVNLFLNDTLIDENFILPKSFYLCMIRYEDGASIARGEEKQLDMVLDVKTFHGRAREKREACAKEGEESLRPAPRPAPPGSTPDGPVQTRPHTGANRGIVRKTSA